MKSIRFFITSFMGGGAEKVLCNLLRALDLTKYRVSVVSLFPGVRFADLPDGIEKRTILKRQSILSRVLQKLPPRLFALLFLRGKFDYEVAYLEGWPTKIVAAMRSDAKKYCFVHLDISVNNPLIGCFRDREEILTCYRRFDRVCFVSEDSRNAFFRTVGELERAAVVHNVQNFADVDQKAQQSCEDYETDGVKLLAVGRLSPEKGFDRLLEAVARLESKYDFQLFLLGEGEDRKKLERSIAERAVRSVRLLGFRENPYPFFRKADLCVFSSRYEGYCTACVEAIHLGVPVLTTDCSGMREILQDGKFGVITENSTEALTAGLERLLREPSLLDGFREAIRQIGRDDRALAENEALFG